MARPQFPFSAKSRRTGDQPISYFMKQALENPGLISLAAGLVDEESLPAGPIAAALNDILGDPASARAALQYGSTPGLLPLRKQVLERTCAADGVTAADVNLTVDDVVITSGSQQLLYLVGELFLDPGDIVITEAPSYFVNHGLLTSHGARVVPVPMDEGGMKLDAVADTLARLDRAGDLPRVKLIYTVDYFQNPTGLSLAPERRPALIELARRYGLLVLEDAAYRELRFDGPDVPSLKRYDTANDTVIFTTTFSKPCSPGLRTGFGLLPRGLATPLLRLKGNHDFGSGNLTQHVISNLLATGAFDRHAAAVRDAYRAKRDVMLVALDRHFPPATGCRWEKPAGGMYVWFRFPNGLDAGPNGELIAAALQREVLYVPGQFCHADSADFVAPKNEARLCYGVATNEQIGEAIRRLRLAFDDVTRDDRVLSRREAVAV